MKIELRGNDKVHVSGYVNATERLSRPIRSPDGKLFVEKISAGAFRKAIERAGDVGVMLNHERELTTVKTDGITLREDNVGLFFDGDITDKEVVEKAKKHELVGWSFGFRALNPKDVESDKAGIDFERTVDEMELYEVSLIDQRKKPYYPATSIFTRADESEIEVRADEGCEYTAEKNDTGKSELALRRRRLKLKSK